MKLNIGCGKKYKPDYINIDFFEDLIADRLMNAVSLDFDDFSCQEIIAIHMVEHLSFFETIYALSEFFRILKPDGKLIIEIPDINKAFQYYLKSDDNQKEEILGWVYGIPYKGLQHKFGFPPFLLIEIFKNIGFHKISKTHYSNQENIPSIRFDCEKPTKNDEFEIFQLITRVRRNLINLQFIDFKDSFLCKEQEDLFAILRLGMIIFKENQKREEFYNLIIETLTNSPRFGKVFIFEIASNNFLLKSEIEKMSDITELLNQLKFPRILLQSIMKAPLVPGSQHLVYSSIESFAKGTIYKLIFQDDEKDYVINKLNEFSESNSFQNFNFFSFKLIERLSLDFFYKGIKFFHQNNYKKAYNNFLKALLLYRDDLFYFWNMAKVLAKMNLKNQALRYYKRTLRFLKFRKFQSKDQIKKEIKRELAWVKSEKESSPEFKPVMSIEEF